MNQSIFSDKFSRYKDSDSDDDDDDDDDDDEESDAHSEVDDITAEIDKVLGDDDDLFNDTSAVGGPAEANAVSTPPKTNKQDISDSADLCEIKNSGVTVKNSRSQSPVASEAESIDLDTLAAEEPVLMEDANLCENPRSATPNAVLDSVADLSDLVSLASADNCVTSAGVISAEDHSVVKADRTSSKSSSSRSDDSSSDSEGHQKVKTHQSKPPKKSPTSQAAKTVKHATSPPPSIKTVVPFSSDKYSSGRELHSPKQILLKTTTGSPTFNVPQEPSLRNRSLSPKEDLADLLAISPRESPSRDSPVRQSNPHSVQTLPDKRPSPYRYTPPKGYRSPQRSPLPKGYRSPYRRSPSLPRQYRNSLSPRRSPLRRRSRSPIPVRPRSPRRSRSPLRRKSRSPMTRVHSPRRRSLSPYSRNRYDRRNRSPLPRRRSPITRPLDDRRGLRSGNHSDKHYDDRHSRDGNRDRRRLNRSQSHERKTRPLSPIRDKMRKEDKKPEVEEPVMSQADLDKLTPEERTKFEARRKKFLGEVQIDPSKKVSLKSIKERKKRKKSGESKNDTNKDDRESGMHAKPAKIKRRNVSNEGEDNSDDEKPSLQDIDDDSEDSDSGRGWREEGNTDRKKAFMPQTVQKEKTALLSLDQISVKGGLPIDNRRRDYNFSRNQKRPDRGRRQELVRHGQNKSMYTSRQSNLENFESEDSDENNGGNSRLTSSIVSKQPFKSHKVEKLRIEVQVTPTIEKVKKKKKEKANVSEVYAVPSKRKMESPEEHNDDAMISAIDGKKTKKIKKAKKEKKEKKKKKQNKIVEGLTADRIIEEVAVANLESSGEEYQIEEEKEPVTSQKSRPSVLERLGKKVKVTHSKEKEKKKKKKKKSVSEDGEHIVFV